MQTARATGESVLYIQRGSISHPKHSPADLDVCMISPENSGQFDADLLILKDDLALVPDAVEAARWAQNLCVEAFGIGAITKILLVILALFGVTTMWFNVVLDGAAVLTTLLLSIRAYFFDQPHKLLHDYLPKKS
jgi:cation transport ATPase